MSETATEQPHKLYRTVDGGRAVEFADGVWENAEFMEWVGGYPIYAKRYA